MMRKQLFEYTAIISFPVNDCADYLTVRDWNSRVKYEFRDLIAFVSKKNFKSIFYIRKIFIYLINN